jgi:hypothetical protein
MCAFVELRAAGFLWVLPRRLATVREAEVVDHAGSG